VTRRFVLESAELDRLRQSLVRTGTSAGGWTLLYSDASGGQRWEERRLYPEQHGGGLPYLMRLPEPTPAQLVDIALESPYLDEAEVAAALLGDHPEQWEAFLVGLESRTTGDRAIRHARLIKASGIASGSNRAGTLGKTMAEIQVDHTHYLELARRANRLLAETPEGRH